MRLLGIKETTKKPDSLTDEVRRSLKLKKLIEENKVDYATLQASLDPRKQKIQKEFDEFVVQINSRKSALISEVTALELRKEKAMEPLDDKWLELQEKEVQLSAREEVVKKQLVGIEADKLQIKEQTLSLNGKEQELIHRDAILMEQEKASDIKAEAIKDQVLQFNKEKAEFNLQATAKEIELMDKENSVTDREKALKITKDSQDKREEDLNNYKKQLDDRQGTLERGFAELRSKNG